jgi:hypothetical protein
MSISFTHYIIVIYFVIAIIAIIVIIIIVIIIVIIVIIIMQTLSSQLNSTRNVLITLHYTALQYITLSSLKPNTRTALQFHTDRKILRQNMRHLGKETKNATSHRMGRHRP